MPDSKTVVKSGSEKPRRCAFHCIKTCDYTKSPYCIIKALVLYLKSILEHDKL